MKRFVLVLSCFFTACSGILIKDEPPPPPGGSVSDTSAGPVFISAFSDLNGKNCTSTKATLDKPQVGEVGAEKVNIPQHCAGYAEYHLTKTFATFETFVSIESAAGDFTMPLTAATECLQVFGPKLEWRLDHNRVFAVIARVTCYKPAAEDETEPFAARNKIGELILVRGLKGFTGIYQDIDANAPGGAWEKARAVADQEFKRIKGI